MIKVATAKYPISPKSEDHAEHWGAVFGFGKNQVIPIPCVGFFYLRTEAILEREDINESSDTAK